MKYYVTGDKKKMKEVKDKLTSLDRAILAKCNGIGMNIIRILKSGKPFTNRFGKREFATTDEVVAAVNKLTRAGILERR